MKFICPTHGEVHSKRIGYSCPATGWCPICSTTLTDINGGINIITDEEALRLRPDYLKGNLKESKTEQKG